MKFFLFSVLGIVFSLSAYADYSYEDIAVLKNMELLNQGKIVNIRLYQLLVTGVIM